MNSTYGARSKSSAEAQITRLTIVSSDVSSNKKIDFRMCTERPQYYRAGSAWLSVTARFVEKYLLY